MSLRRRKYCLIIILTFLFSACSITKNNFLPRNLYFLYDNYTENIHPNILLYNTSDTTSLLIVKLNSKDLLFNKANRDKELKAFINISYQVLDIENKNQIVDSSDIQFRINKPLRDSALSYIIPIKAFEGKNHLVKIIAEDINKEKSSKIVLKYLDRTRDSLQNDFLLRGKDNKEILYSPFVCDSNSFTINHRKNIVDSMMVLFYGERNNVAINPNIEIDTLNNDFEIPDSSWMWYSDSTNYSYNKNGIYRFCFDSISKKGFSLYNFGKTFPVIHTPKELIEPLKYIADSLEEFEQLENDKLTKLAVDNFWLERAENLNRSRDLLNIYYTRVINANYYFTSYKQGWKTDRGMIYIVYGLPDGIYKSGENEKWVYNPRGAGPGLVFIFDYKFHQFSSNNFILNREKLKYTQWDNSIILWRDGEVVYYQR
ncbi:MAG: GWxTD domain-containing protein [Bacteroidota bacterium]|nr:GWxTD domain-containing protein [Bacteroidota bacterium]